MNRSQEYPTGFTDFDEMTSGLQAGDLIIVAGRPSMGKTAFAMNMAEHAAIRSENQYWYLVWKCLVNH